jgi:predicted lipoprotein with Yx(FWY)xxD motif
LVGLLAAAVAMASMSAVAIAATSTLTTGKASVSGTTKTVVVNAHGVTLYTLSGESRTHLKCTSSMCLKFWPPYKVAAGAKLSKTSAVHGTIGKLSRAGFNQVTLNGHPLYAFMGDAGKKGSAMGEGIAAFGGTWHVVSPCGLRARS